MSKTHADEKTDATVNDEVSVPAFVVTVVWIVMLGFHIHRDACENAYEPPRGKTNKMTVRPAKTQINLGRPV